MRAKINISEKDFTVNLNKPIDISLTLYGNQQNVTAWYKDVPSIKPVQDGNWVASVKEGASVNFNDISFNPHAHGTHTECVGHISKKFYSINDCLTQFFFEAQLISLTPELSDGDSIFTADQIRKALNDNKPEALIIRTLPNTSTKKSFKYSHTNWPYLLEEAALLLRKLKVKHLLIDLPSVDREKDDGKLLAHKAFWNYPAKPRLDASITELIYVPNTVKDGQYLLNLQISSFHNDASPSKPILYELV
ncbi:cyclase family protein [Mesonia sediminis]|uniref:Cyclase family protein n=1 Tax=Mesonia sediminis TaxID=1703946 RepID=A0ABW5SHQ7_9FLAO